MFVSKLRSFEDFNRKEGTSEIEDDFKDSISSFFIVEILDGVDVSLTESDTTSRLFDVSTDAVTRTDLLSCCGSSNISNSLSGSFEKFSNDSESEDSVKNRFERFELILWQILTKLLNEGACLRLMSGFRNFSVK